MTIKNRGGVFGRNPTFNDVDVDGTLSIAGAAVPAPANTLTTSDIGSTVQAYDADTAKLDVAQTFTQNQVFNGTIGVGTSAPSKKFVVSNSEQAGIEIDPFTRSATEGTSLLSYNRNTSAFVRADYDALNHVFFASTSEKARITSDGITFNGDTAAANALDDYEEGLATVTMTPNSSGSITLDSSTNALSYTKVGRLVTLTGFIQVSAVSSPVGSYVTLAGLPFAAAAEAGALKYGSRSGAVLMFSDTTTRANGFLGGGGSGLNFFFDASTVSAPDGFYLNFSYITA